jgi:hypothetical protein
VVEVLQNLSRGVRIDAVACHFGVNYSVMCVIKKMKTRWGGVKASVPLSVKKCLISDT